VRRIFFEVLRFFALVFWSGTSYLIFQRTGFLILLAFPLAYGALLYKPEVLALWHLAFKPKEDSEY
jgi:hypothetical protein